MTRYTHPDLPGFLSPGVFQLNGVTHPAIWWNHMTEQEILDLGFEVYIPPEIEEPEPDPNYIISKATAFRRMTDTEAEVVDGIMNDTTARMRNIFLAAQYLDTTDDLWDTMYTILENAFGTTRADEILARED